MQRWNRPEPAPTKRSTFTIPTTDRATQVARLRRDASRYAICTTCHGLREIPPGRRSEPLQPCACSPERLRREWNTDLAERVHLCECCCLELLPSGSRFSVWFCPDCGDRVRELNAQLGRYTIPLARHSFMAGVGIPGRVLLDADEEQLSAISESLRLGILGWIESISRLHAYTSDRIDDLARVVGLDGLDTIPLATFLERVDETTAHDRAVAKVEAFRALVRWFATTPPSTTDREEAPSDDA